jgi:taurine--2-oxoglutarate transaminase
MNVNIGHQHPKLIAAIKDQADQLATIAPFHANEARSEAARLITEKAGGDLDMVFFTNGGAEANENAIRMARLHTGRHKVLATYRSYHGATHGAISLTGDPRRWPSEPAIPGTVHFWGPYPYRSAFNSDSPEQETERALQHLAGVRELCDQHGILLIADEVMAGFGRCGEWFSIQHWDVEPDLICFAKGVNSGYVPLGGVIISRAVADTFAERPYPGGLTYSGHPLACASAVASIRIFEEEGLVERARRMGDEVAGPALRELADRHPSIGDVRGLGQFWALELVKDRTTREQLVPFNASGPAAAPVAEVVAACKKQGLLVFAHFNRIHVVPPLTISEEDFAHGVSILDDALTLADAHVA